MIQNRSAVEAKEYYKAEITVKGIKKRERKVKNHRFGLGYMPFSEKSLDVEFFEKFARIAIDKNMREVAPDGVFARLYHTKVISDTADATIEQWSPFSGLNKSIPLKV